MTPQAAAFVKDLLTPWWWSPLPPWRYIKNQYGWGKLQEPGVFNLVWLSSGEPLPCDDYKTHTNKILWALVDAPRIQIAGDSLPNHACALTLKEFESMIIHHRQALDRWAFHDGSTTSARILSLIRHAQRSKA